MAVPGCLDVPFGAAAGIDDLDVIGIRQVAYFITLTKGCADTVRAAFSTEQSAMCAEWLAGARGSLVPTIGQGLVAVVSTLSDMQH